MKKLSVMYAMTLVFLLFALPSQAAPGATGITWFGQSAFRVTTPGGKVLLIDPWISNPANPNAKQDLESLKKVDLILLTHGHGDHIGNSAEISRKTGAKLVATSDLSRAMVQYGGFPEANTDRQYVGSFGGEITLLDGEVKVQFIPAVHGGSMEAVEGSKMPKSLLYGGPAGGFLISVRNGPRIYHTGDTDLFGDMGLLNGSVDIMVLCIGDKFTMGPRRAAQAVKLVMPQLAVPMHFGTFAALTGTPDQLRAELGLLGLDRLMRLLKVGETLTWK